MNLKEIVELVAEARMRYEEALMRRINIDGEKRRYTNILITHASDLIAAAQTVVELAEAEEAAVNAVARTEGDIVENPSVWTPSAVVVDGEGKLAVRSEDEAVVSLTKSKPPRKGAKEDGVSQT